MTATRVSAWSSLMLRGAAAAADPTLAFVAVALRQAEHSEVQMKAGAL